MNPQEIRELIEFLVEKDIAEFELERGDLKMRVKRGVETHIVAAPAMQYGTTQTGVTTSPTPVGVAGASPSTVAPAPSAPAPEEEEELHIVRSPIVGTYYEAPSPGAPVFAKIGDVVKSGQPLCIVEAMKLMNEIEADASGEIVKIYVSNAQPVEYGQPLFGIRAS